MNLPSSVININHTVSHYLSDVFVGTYGNLFRQITTDFYLQSEGIISNHTVETDIECALFCIRLENCLGFGYRTGRVKIDDGINCQLVERLKQDHIHEQNYAESWTFFQTVNVYGTKGIPGRSCEDILKKRSGTNDIRDGIYWMTLGTAIDQPFPVYCDMENGGWILVFKTIAGENGTINNIWSDSLTREESSLDALNKNNSFKRHYKNRMVQDWETFNPTEVRVVLYTQTKEHVVLKFNASGTNNMDWFSIDRLQEPPWQDIFSSPKNFFSIDGSCSKQVKHRCRSFFINSIYNHCLGDAGWLMIGGSTACPWETRFPGNSFQYSKSETNVTWRSL
ncbi:uncharacterized protein LOC114527792 [Dendronephthya gigantea]|uniref:uncharacterized protein LOC114527792 n=1 Tax=Dendronephthya gigantea TaxID=151771 RepID=UPI00106ABF70|nr:uncharacterized protein LOC114527792 [Dendronephthya gigantea]